MPLAPAAGRGVCGVLQNRPMPYTLAWPGSELRDLTLDGDGARLRLSAASVQGGWLSNVTLVLADATVQGEASQAFGRIAAGRLRVDGRDLALQLPQQATGAIELDLRLANGAQVVVQAAALAARAADDTRFTEDLSC